MSLVITIDETENTWTPELAIDGQIRQLLDNPANHIHAFIQIIRYLKTSKRTGWLDRGVPSDQTELIADHMYRMAVLAMIVPRLDISIDTCVKIAIIHDIAELLVGDIPPYVNVLKQEKHRREYETIKYLSLLVKTYNPKFAEELVELWLDYEEIRTVEARYIKDIDKLEMIQQAFDYEQQFGLKYDMTEFYQARLLIKTEEIGKLCDELIERRTQWKEQQLTQQSK